MKIRRTTKVWALGMIGPATIPTASELEDEKTTEDFEDEFEEEE